MSESITLGTQEAIGHLPSINYTTIMEMLITSVKLYTANRAMKKYRLYRDFKAKSISELSMPPVFYQETLEVDFEKIAAKAFGNIVMEFTKTMIEKIPRENLNLFYHNINELVIKQANFTLINMICDKRYVGKYDVKNNVIKANIQDFLSTIYHELLHMASSVFKDGIKYSGFSQTSNKKGFINIGVGLTEGYTQFLTERYFGLLDKASVCEKHIAEKLEEIVGKKKMESLYFNANLPGLIDELGQYASSLEIAEFISGLDYVESFLKTESLSPFRYYVIENSLKKIYTFLIKTYMQKLRICFTNNMINGKELDHLLEKYIHTLGTYLFFGENYFLILKNDEIETIKKDILGDLFYITKEDTNSTLVKIS